MAAVELRCRQCGWSSRLAADRVPRYGARVRCPRCDSLQLVLPGAPQPPAERWSAESGAAGAAGAHSVPMPVPRVAPPPVAGGAPRPRDAGEPAPEETAEARQVLRRWLEELRRQASGPLDVARVFGEHGDELAHLYALWSAAYPGERSRALFRRELLDALEGLAGAGGPAPERIPAATRVPSAPERIPAATIVPVPADQGPSLPGR